MLNEKLDARVVAPDIIANDNDNNGNFILQNTGGVLTTYTWDQENRLANREFLTLIDINQ